MKQRTSSASMTNNNRKTFSLLHSIFTGLVLWAMLLMLSASIPMPGLAQTPVRVRKEFRQLTPTEWQRFVSAVKKLNTRLTSTQSSTYDRFVNIHLTWQHEVHNYPMYFPFHRKYLLEFEKALQQIDPLVTLPYWDWSKDAQAPHLSPIFTASYMGGNGRATDSIVNTGSFANWRVFYPNNHYLKRNFDGANNTLSPWYPSDLLQRLSTNSKTYDSFRQAIEFVPVGSVHVGIGGDMSTMSAPNDPIYWLHMAFVDKLWDSWQRARLAQFTNYNGTNRNGSFARLSDFIPGYPGVLVSSVMDTTKLGYSYK